MYFLKLFTCVVNLHYLYVMNVIFVNFKVKKKLSFWKTVQWTVNAVKLYNVEYFKRKLLNYKGTNILPVNHKRAF